MFFSGTPYLAASFWALSGVPDTSAATLAVSHFANAGRIWLMLRLPSPTTAQPSLRPGGSGTRCAAAVAAATCETSTPAPACCRNPRRERRGVAESLMGAILDQPPPGHGGSRALGRRQR